MTSDFSSTPNLVFLLADDLGWGDLSIDGQTHYTTPHLDQLAQEGARFSTAYSSSPVCTPTRIGFLTGRYPGRLPIGIQEPLTSFKRSGQRVGLPPEHPTVASLLKAKGYHTALVGKWHCGYLPDYSPLKSGFDEFYGVFSGAVDYFRHVDTDGNPDLWENEIPIEAIGYITDLFTQRAVDYIQKPHQKPFFLALHYTAPHWPWEGPKDLELSQSLSGRDTLKNWIDTGDQTAYGEVVKSLDQSVGKVLAALEEAGLTQNTLVVFASDNGGEKYSNMGQFRGQKGSVHEGGIRVPTFIRWPQIIPAGIISEQSIMTSDITATLLAAARVESDPHYPLDGIDLLPLLTGKVAAFPRLLFWRYRGVDVPVLPPPILQGAAREGAWKYIRVGEQEFLYNLSGDPQESTDQKENYPEIFQKLKADYDSWNAELVPYT